MIFLPHPIEERDHPVIEDVEETRERSVLVARAIHHQLSVLMRKNSQGTDGAHNRTIISGAAPSCARSPVRPCISHAGNESVGRVRKRTPSRVASAPWPTGARSA